MQVSQSRFRGRRRGFFSHWGRRVVRVVVLVADDGGGIAFRLWMQKRRRKGRKVLR